MGAEQKPGIKQPSAYKERAGEHLLLLSSTKVWRYSAKKTLLTLNLCADVIAGSQEGSEQREKLSQTDTDDRTSTVIPGIAKVTS